MDVGDRLGHLGDLAADLVTMHWIGFSPETWKKIALTVSLAVGVGVATYLLRCLVNFAMTSDRFSKPKFWVRQLISFVSVAVMVIGALSIWVVKPETLTATLGMVTAGVAFALQRVITAFAGYLVILRGKTFKVGDRISIGGVRGDVIDIGFMQIFIMEMG